MDTQTAEPRSWRARGTSVAGFRHLSNGVPCQDAFKNVTTGPGDDRVTVLAVADGAGSREHSEQGSALAVDLAADVFGRRALNRSAEYDQGHRRVSDLLMEGFRDVRAEFLRRKGRNADDFATTLTVVVLTRAWVGYLSVGDGFVVVRAGTEAGKQQYHLLPQPDPVSEYGNETVFLTSRDAEDRVLSHCLRDGEIDGVMLSTDGLAQAALNRSGDLPNVSFVSTMFSALDSPRPDPAQDDKALEAFLSSERLTRLNTDDKTVLRAVLR